MCGRFTMTDANRERIAALLGVPVEELVEEHVVPRWNVAPTDMHWIARAEHAERREALRASWGLVNWWDRDRREGVKHLNARAESVETRRPFKEAFAERRCIVPADGYYEWVGEKKDRRPYWFHRPDRGLFVFAGLYSITRLKGEAEATPTFTIITTDPNKVSEPIHDRMPVILPDEDAIDEWLYPKQRAERLRELMRPAPDDFLVATPVSQRVNSVKHDDAACIEEVAAPAGQGTLL